MSELAKKLDGLEGEFKLMKGELRQTLLDVRAFIQKMNLPAEIEILEAPEPRPMPEAAKREPESASRPTPPEPGPTAGTPPWDMPRPAQEGSSRPGQDRPLDRPPSFGQDSPSWPEPPGLAEREGDRAGRKLEEPMQPENKEAKPMREGDEAVQTTSQVNMMANLIRWVSAAKRDIGLEQLPIFLDTYAIAGRMSPGLREFILGLAETIDEKAQDSDLADAWSRLILELHGILTGGGSPLMPEEPAFAGFNGGKADAEPEDVEPKPEPVRLKLVLPIGSGQEKEFSVTLNPDDDV